MVHRCTRDPWLHMISCLSLLARYLNTGTGLPWKVHAPLFGKVLEHWYGPSLEGTRPALVAERRNYYNRYISVYFDLCKPVSHFQKTVSTRVWVRL